MAEPPLLLHDGYSYSDVGSCALDDKRHIQAPRVIVRDAIGALSDHPGGFFAFLAERLLATGGGWLPWGCHSEKS